jgi:hypothetical protein
MSVEPSISFVLLGSCYNYFGASAATIFSKRRSPRDGFRLTSLCGSRAVLTLIAEQTKATLWQTSRANFSCRITRNSCATLSADSDWTNYYWRVAFRSPQVYYTKSYRKAPRT